MRAAFLITVSVAAILGCGSEPTKCTMDSECVTGTTCQSGVCGVFTRAQPAGCVPLTDVTSFQVVDHSALEMKRPGCWVACDPPMPRPGPAPANAIGWGFDSDLTRWWFLVDDGHGNPVPFQGFDQAGIVDILWPGINTDQLQVDMVPDGNTTLTFTLQPRFSDGPPLRMISFGVDTVYVQPEGSCGDVDGGTGSGSDMGNAAPFGGACNPNYVLSTDCPAVDGRRCSFCGESTCRQPCHIGGSDCPSSQTCTAFGLTSVTMAGDCIGYDGFCS